MALLGPHGVPNPLSVAPATSGNAASGNIRAAETAHSRQGCPRSSAASPGTPPEPAALSARAVGAGGCGASALHVAKPSKNCRGLNFVTSLLLIRTFPPAGRCRLPSRAAPLWQAVLGGYFQILGDIPLPLSLIGPRRSPPPHPGCCSVSLRPGLLGCRAAGAPSPSHRTSGLFFVPLNITA